MDMTFTDANLATAVQAGDAPVVRPQIAALCWRLRRGKVEVLLITSRDTRRWIVPKGWMMDGQQAHEAAEIEAWEEAGVKGKIAAKALGQFTYDKLHPSKPAMRCEVAVYPLRVSRMEHKFPEQKERSRKWFSARKAARLVAEAELSAIIQVAAQSLAKG